MPIRNWSPGGILVSSIFQGAKQNGEKNDAFESLKSALQDAKSEDVFSDPS